MKRPLPLLRIFSFFRPRLLLPLILRPRPLQRHLQRPLRRPIVMLQHQPLIVAIFSSSLLHLPQLRMMTTLSLVRLCTKVQTLSQSVKPSDL